jgi:sugar phosphate isomerase/epimerase
MVLGAQLYTLRSFTQNELDLERTLEKVRGIGYSTVQLSAIGAGIKPERIREICDRLGLNIVLTHSDFNRILYDTDRLIEEHNILGCDYIGLGGMPEKYRDPDWFPYFVEDIMAPVRKIASVGKLFMYHNHNFEFEKKNGIRLIERLLEAFGPDEVGFTLDTYWVQAAGCDIVQWINILKDRIPCVHLKDMTVSGMEIRMAPVLEGNMNFPAVFEALRNTNAKYLLVEQDTCYSNPFDCLKMSYDNIAKFGFK